MRHATTEEVDIYPVGLLNAWQQYVHAVDRPAARRSFRYALRYPLRQIKARNWRAVKSWFNGYLAEPADWPDGLTRCGTGWTRGRAYRDLADRINRIEETR